jgi:hypothetical protein
MLDNNLMEYYSDTMIKDLRDAAAPAAASATPQALPQMGTR